MHLAKSLTDIASFLEQEITIISEVAPCDRSLIGSV